MPLSPAPSPVRTFLLGVLFAVLWGSPVLAQSPSLPDSVRRAALEAFHGPDLKGKDGPLAKAGLDLLLLYHQHRTRPGGAQALSSAAESGGAARGGLQIQDGRVVIDATAAGDVAALAADLDSLGMTDVATAGGLVSGRFPIAKIPALARLPTLRGVVPSRMRTQSGASGGDAAPARSLRPEDVDRPRAAEPSPEASDTAVAAPSPPSEPDPKAAASPAAPSTSSSDEAPSSATSPAADVPSSRMLDDAGEASAVLWLLIVLMATVLLLEER